MSVPLPIQRTDLLSICPRWLELTAEMCDDQRTLNEIPWVCEMRGYAIAAAEAGLARELGHLQQFPKEEIDDRPLLYCSYANENRDHDWK